MRKQLPVVAALILSLALTGCASVNVNVKTEKNAGSGAEEPMAGMADPWREITAEEAAKYPRMFVAPKDASNVVWRILDSGADAKTGKEPLIELDFDIKDEYGATSFCARYQYGAGEKEDISGMYYDWAAIDDGKLSNWGMGNMDAKFYRFVGDNEMADLCTWYDIEIGIGYSLSTVAPDLDGFDIQGVVEAMYPGDQIYSDE